MTSTNCIGNYNPEDKECTECELHKECMSRSILMVPLDQIDYTPDPSRDANGEKLDASIKTKGILQPIVATYDKGKFKLVFGGRRYQSAKSLKLKEIPVVVREADDFDRILLRLHENIHRENYSPMGICKALEDLRDKHGLKQKEIAEVLGKSEGWVSKHLSPSKLPESVKEKVESGEVKMGAERASQLARMPEEKAEKLVEKGATKEQVTKASRGRKLKYQWTHKGKIFRGTGFKTTIIFNDEDISPEEIKEALEVCKEEFK